MAQWVKDLLLSLQQLGWLLWRGLDPWPGNFGRKEAKREGGKEGGREGGRKEGRKGRELSQLIDRLHFCPSSQPKGPDPC